MANISWQLLLHCHIQEIFGIEYMQGVSWYILMKSGRRCYAFTKYVQYVLLVEEV